MRKSRGGGSPFKSNGAPVPDSVSLLRSFDMNSNPTRPVRPSPLTASTISDMPLDLVDRIRSFPLFLSAPEAFLAAIGKHLRPQIHSPYDRVLTEGDDAKAMYWLVRGAVAVTSRDGEATYAELKPGAFFGEIGILMNVPRTATIVARTKCLLVVLKKEDLQKELPNFPEMRQAIMEEAQERLMILNRKKQEGGAGPKAVSLTAAGSHIARDPAPGEVTRGDSGTIQQGLVINTKKRKSPSPGVTEDPTAGSALGSGLVNVRKTLTELPLFSNLPPETLHFLGLSAQPKIYPPFTDIIQQGSEGLEIYFIVRGEAEVIHETNLENDHGKQSRASYIRPRLRQGQYFGEVASLELAPRRTATVRAITTVECLMIGGEVLKELWARCRPDIREQVEATAKTRIEQVADEDVLMVDSASSTPKIRNLEIGDRPSTPTANSVPQVTFTRSNPASSHQRSRVGDYEVIEPLDPDPFLSVDMDNMRARTRRGSYAPPQPETAPPNGPRCSTPPPTPTRSKLETPMSSKLVHATTPPDVHSRLKRPRTQRQPSQLSKGLLPDTVLVGIFSYLDIYQAMFLRAVSLHWCKLLSTSPEILQYLDLSIYNRRITNDALVDFVCPFVGQRPHTIDISNCFHITDDGFQALINQCGSNVRGWKMKSVWDITANAVLDMANHAKELEEIDLSNCRKVSDNLLARIVGWVVTDAGSQSQRGKNAQPLNLPPVGTVVGCPKLKKLTLSYCKHVTDRSMAHLAVHAHDRLQSIDLTRCTTITDNGFQHWSIYQFSKLEKLCLADCTYLTDNAIVYLANAAKGLRELDLVCCT